MKQYGDVRSTSGAPTLLDFNSSKGTPLVIDITSGNLYYINSTGAIATAGGGGGGGAPTNATYLTLSLNASLTAERVLTAGVGISFVDTGANGTLTVSVTNPVNWTETEVDFGSTPAWGASFTIVDASIDTTSKVAVLPSGKPATGRAAGDDQWDSVMYSALPAGGSMTVYALAHPGPVVGKRTIQYQVL